MDEKYFVTKITTDMLDENTGKIKKMREEKLVKGYSPTDVDSLFPFFFCIIIPKTQFFLKT